MKGFQDQLSECVPHLKMRSGKCKALLKRFLEIGVVFCLFVCLLLAPVFLGPGLHLYV